MSKELLGNVRFVKEKNMIKNFFQNIDRDTKEVIFGLRDTMKCVVDGIC